METVERMLAASAAAVAVASVPVQPESVASAVEVVVGGAAYQPSGPALTVASVAAAVAQPLRLQHRSLKAEHSVDAAALIIPAASQRRGRRRLGRRNLQLPRQSHARERDVAR